VAARACQARAVQDPRAQQQSRPPRDARGHDPREDPTHLLPTPVPDTLTHHPSLLLCHVAGILFNELTRSPTAVTDSILALTGLALELDSGKYDPNSANCAASLYILRVAARKALPVRACPPAGCNAAQRCSRRCAGVRKGSHPGPAAW
jgi:hypothetical protein